MLVRALPALLCTLAGCLSSLDPTLAPDAPQAVQALLDAEAAAFDERDDRARYVLLSRVYTGEALTAATLAHSRRLARAAASDESQHLVSLRTELPALPSFGDPITARRTLAIQLDHPKHQHERRVQQHLRVRLAMTSAGPRISTLRALAPVLAGPE